MMLKIQIISIIEGMLGIKMNTTILLLHKSNTVN